jgi:hypothetical protein
MNQIKNMSKEVIVPEEVVINKIYPVRGKKVMLDKDLAELYGVTTPTGRRLSTAILRPYTVVNQIYIIQEKVWGRSGRYDQKSSYLPAGRLRHKISFRHFIFFNVSLAPPRYL